MDGKENKSKRPPRLPSHSGQPVGQPLSSTAAHDEHKANRQRSRGRSTTRKSAASNKSIEVSLSATCSKSIGAMTEATVSIGSGSGSGSSSEYNYMKRRATNTSATRSLPRTKDSNATAGDFKLDARDNLGFSTITCTPQVPRHRSQSRTGAHNANANANAPKKKIRAHSKQHLIRKKEYQHPPSSTARASSLSEPIMRLSHDSSVNHSDVSVNTRNSRGHSVHSVASRANDDYHNRRTRSGSRTSVSRTVENNHTSRARSQSSTRTPNVRASTRPRSHSRTSYSRKGNRSRANSVSSHGKIRTSFGTSVSSGQFEVEPNVHHNAIMTTEIECPVIAEMKENELYAKKNGMNFTMEGGDALVSLESNRENMLIQDENHKDDFVVSPRFNRNVPGGFLYDEDDLPANALFLRRDEGTTKKNIIGAGTDFAQLKMVAGQLCIGWGAKEYETPTIARRIIDFQFAQMKRRKKFGNERPWGILGLYDHLSAVRMDVEWADTVACRRANGEPYKAWFHFVGEKNTGKNRPFFTFIILCICTGFMLASIALNGWKIEPFSANPMIGPSAETLVAMGAKDSYLIVREGELWRIFSPMVLHAGFIHFFFNMLALWFVGKAIEECHGFFASMLLFVVPGIGGTILSAIFLPNMISVGASGGIFGLIGACLADIYMNWGLLFNKFVNGKQNHGHIFVLLVLLMDIVVNSLIGLTPFVDNFTHLGGMIFGFICGTSLMHRVSTDMFEGQKKRTLWTTFKQHFSRFFGIILTVVIMIASLLILLQGDGQSTPCKSCTAISCVAFPPWAGENDKWWYCDDCGVVTADAKMNVSTGKFDELSLNCPYGDIFTLAIENDMSTDRDWLENQLPKWCRSHCEGI